MKIKKISIALIMVLVIAGFSFASGSSESQGSDDGGLKPITISIGYASAEGQSGDIIVKEEAARILEESDGKFKFDIYPAAQLGGDREMAESVQLGDQGIIFGAPSPLVSFVPEVAILDMPMAFAGYSWDEIDAVMNGDVGDFRAKMDAAYEKAGFKLLSLFSSQMYREMSSNKPVKTIEDFNGIRIRTMENKFHMNFWNSLGASATPINFAELYLALQQGLVDAQENPIAVVVLNGLFEQQDYIIMTDHVLFFLEFVMGLDTYNNLSAEQKVLLDDFIASSSPRIAASGGSDDEMFTAMAIEKGVEFLEPSDKLVADMKKVAQKTSAMIAEDVGKDLVDSLFDSLVKASSK